jgi:Nucleotidyltransferase domain
VKIRKNAQKAVLERDAAWGDALAKFLNPLRKRKEVLGAVLAGSRAAGTETKQSDIDVHIVLSDSSTWRERGNVMIGGYCIEYFMNPASQLRAYRRENYRSGNKIDARMFAFGRILFDKTGEVSKIQRESARDFKKEFKRQSKTATELGKYLLWDDLDNLVDVHASKAPTYAYVHALLLQRSIETYARFLKAELVPPSKLYRFLTDATFAARYRIAPFPDRQFVKLFLDCASDSHPTRIERLVQYVLAKMGGFKLDGWRLRGPLMLD